MGVFYAYLNDDQTDCDRSLITFANREAADEWWRMISTPPSPYATQIRRVSPQFYTQHDANIRTFFSNPELPDAKQFHRKMTITALYHHIGTSSIIIPPFTFTDHISGRWYFVKSKADPWSHWYLRVQGACLVCGNENCEAVHVSSEHRTKFCIRVRNPTDDLLAHKDLVMIGRDEISITAHKGHTVHISDTEDLKATKGYQGETDFVLDDLKDRFLIRGERRVNGEIWEYVESVERGSGEAWELVS